RNSSDVLVTNTTVGMQISILQGSASGTVVYTETQTPTTNANGLVSIEIGGGAGFSTIDWANDIYFIKTETDPTGGNTYTITGTSQLLSVPYALHAKTAESVSGGITETDPVFIAWDKSTGISVTESQISDLGTYIETETDPAVAANFDFTDAATGDLLQYNGTKWVKVTPDYISDYTVTETDVITHEAAITVTESQISDLGTYIETETQTISDVAALDNSVNTQLKNVTNPTDAQDAATKVYVDELRGMILDLQAENGVTDSRDGTHYDAVKIGNQVWMAENLKYLPSVVGPATGSQTTPYYYYVYDYDGTDVTAAKATANYTTYGVLYNWPAATNACPTGWHLPSDAEWTELTDYLGGESVAGGKLKEIGTTHWNTPNTGATNETGFTALPGGYRYGNGAFDDIGYGGYWWSATELSTSSAWNRSMNCNDSDVGRSNYGKEVGFSVRCVRD
ncbi:MAG: fibrobacter succinogenes major paralogous domain-containing protein, partial [Bacteroidales bacterium]|nr:fibrobacter succinogenes major paralogous domain-containing protein [Bacteroidales bacterium]